jgi:uncharacterized protein YpuA (DUF1002 family)
MQSWSVALDLAVAYNLERLFFIANGYDKEKVKDVMKKFDQTLNVQLTESEVEQLKKIVDGESRFKCQRT